MVLIPKDSKAGNRLVGRLRSINSPVGSPDNSTYYLVVFRTESAYTANAGKLESVGLYGAAASVGMHNVTSSSSAYGGAAISSAYGGAASSSAYGGAGSNGAYPHQAASSSSSYRDRDGDRGGNRDFSQPRGSSSDPFDANHHNLSRSLSEPAAAASAASLSVGSYFPAPQSRPTVSFASNLTSMAGEIIVEDY